MSVGSVENAGVKPIINKLKLIDIVSDPISPIASHREESFFGESAILEKEKFCENLDEIQIASDFVSGSHIMTKSPLSVIAQVNPYSDGLISQIKSSRLDEKKILSGVGTM